MQEKENFYEFDGFRLNPSERQLLRGGVSIPLAPKAFETLLILVESSGRLLTKEVLMQRLWPGTFVEEVNLAQNISTVRKALKEAGGEDGLIETVPKVGYRFTGSPKRMSFGEATVPENAPPPEIQVLESRTARVAIGLGVLVVALAGLAIYGYKSGRFGAATPGTSAIRSIAILPLANLSQDPAQEFFSDGLTDELITKVAKIGSLRVISRTSVMGYKHSDKKVPAIGSELHVDSIVEGTVQRANNRVRIRVQLIRTDTDQHIWAETYDRDVADILDVQNEVAQTIAREIRIRLTPEEQVSLAQAKPVKPDAYDAFLRGRYHWNRRTEADLVEAERLLQEAVKLEPLYAPAYAALADTYSLQAQYGSAPPAATFVKAKEATRRALELDPSLPEAHASAANVALLYDYDWGTAEREFQRAIALNPNYATARQWYAEYLSATRQTDRAVEQLTRALDVDPNSRIINVAAGRPFYYARQYQRAIDQFRRALILDDNLFPAHALLARALCANGEYDEALAEAHKASLISPGNLTLLAEEGYILGKAGKTKEAMQFLQRLKDDAKRRYVPSDDVAVVLTGMGRRDEAIAFLEAAYKERSTSVVHFATDPRFDELRNDPRFQKLMEKIGLPG